MCGYDEGLGMSYSLTQTDRMMSDLVTLCLFCLIVAYTDVVKALLCHAIPSETHTDVTTALIRFVHSI